MKQKWVITIGREYCSGGAATGHAVADLLGIAYYDKSIVDEAANLAKVDNYTASKLDEKPVSYMSMASSLMSYTYNNYYAGDPDLMMPVGLKVAAAQSQVIESVADRESCVIVGRCADFVLRNRENVFKVFLRADLGTRVARAMELYGLDAANAKKLIKQTDKIRASYYNGHTQQVWGDPANQHLVLDVGKLGIQGAARVIVEAVKALDEK